MSRQFWQELLVWATADGTSVANLTTETIIFPNVAIPGNYMQDGRALRLTAMGRISWTTGAPTIRFRLRWGGISGTPIMWDTDTMKVTGVGVTAAAWKLDICVQTRANGATGTLFTMGEAWLSSGAEPQIGVATGLPASGIYGSAGRLSPAATTHDLTTDPTQLSLTGQWSAASASNTLTGHIYVIESLN
jgi:hypothetical protein